MKDILSFDRELTENEKDILQTLIDTSYQQFVQTVAEARQLSVDTVKSFADGRIFTGEQALSLGLVDRLGTEEDARSWAAELVGLDPEKATLAPIEEPKPLTRRLLPLGQVGAGLDWLEFELTAAGQPLWLYRP